MSGETPRTVFEGSTLELELTGLHGTRIYSEKIAKIKQEEPNIYHYTKLRCGARSYTLCDLIRIHNREGPKGPQGPCHKSEIYIGVENTSCRVLEDFKFFAESSSLDDISSGLSKYRESQNIKPSSRDILMM
jgi:hypothetical protein